MMCVHCRKCVHHFPWLVPTFKMSKYTTTNFDTLVIRIKLSYSQNSSSGVKNWVMLSTPVRLALWLLCKDNGLCSKCDHNQPRVAAWRKTCPGNTKSGWWHYNTWRRSMSWWPCPTPSLKKNKANRMSIKTDSQIKRFLTGPLNDGCCGLSKCTESNVCYTIRNRWFDNEIECSSHW